jgi:hypothetical protein
MGRLTPPLVIGVGAAQLDRLADDKGGARDFPLR